MLPSVTTSQILVRRHRPGATITCDGRYGPRTKAAVASYQREHSLSNDGIIGPNTWNSFMAVSGFQTIDVVDGTDPSLIAFEASDIGQAGGTPIVVFGQSNGCNSRCSRSQPEGAPTTSCFCGFTGTEGEEAKTSPAAT